MVLPSVSHASIEVTIYSKPDCPLCDEMTATVRRVQGKESWSITHIDIESDPKLKAEYKEQIPVMFINGRKSFKAHVTEAQLRKKIMKAKEVSARRDSSDSPSLAWGEDYVPPRMMVAAFILAVTVAFSYFVYQGLTESKTGLRDLSGKLLRVESRDLAPVAFDLEKFDGGKLDLASLKDKVVFLNFWATWCPPCVKEMPSIRRLHEKLAGRSDFVMLLISADDSWSPVRKFFKTERPQFTVLLDPEGEIAKQYGTSRFPETYIIVNGKIHAFIEGPRDWDAWFAEAYLTSFLES